MKQKDVFKKIGGIIQELSDQYEYLQTVNGDLNELELELFVANAHFLTDHIEVLCKLNLQNSTLNKRVAEKQETSYEQKYFEPVVQQMKHATGLASEKPEKATAKPVEPEKVKPVVPDEQPVIPEAKKEEPVEKPVEIVQPVSEEPEIIKHELVLDEAMMLDDDEQLPEETEPIKDTKKRKTAPAEATEPETEPEAAIEAEELLEEPIALIVEETKTVVEEVVIKTEDEVLTINQKISVQMGDKVLARTEQLSIKPISDIKLAITLNDKLLYVKDLFNGYNLAYSEAIEILNRFNTFEEATRFLKTNYVTKNNWESKPATTEKFYALLKRRYA